MKNVGPGFKTIQYTLMVLTLLSVGLTVLEKLEQRRDEKKKKA